MPTSDAQKKATLKYKAKHYKRVPLELSKEYYDTKLKPAADAAEESVNGYIKKAIDMRIDSENDQAD